MEQEEILDKGPGTEESRNNFSVLTNEEVNPIMMKRMTGVFRTIVVFFSLAIAAVIAMAVCLQLNDDYRKKAESLSTRWVDIQPVRGTIYSDDGHPLAVDIERYRLFFDPQSNGFPADSVDTVFMKKLPELAHALSTVSGDFTERQYIDTLTLLYNIHKDSAAVVKKIMAGLGKKDLKGRTVQDSAVLKFRKIKRMKHALVKTRLTNGDLARLRSMSQLMCMSQYKTGIVPDKTSKREYPNGNVARRTIGIKDEQAARSGLELSLNDLLSGKKGIKKEVRVSNTVWRSQYDVNNIDVINGYDVITTIDLELQTFLQEALGQQLQAVEADWATAIVLDVKTGDVKAVANADIGPKKELRVETCDEFYAVRMLREPGSTFKTVALMCMIDDKGVPLTRIFDTPTQRHKTIQIADAKITDDHPAGPSSVQRILEQSSNIGMARIADAYYRSDPERLIKRVEDVGLYAPLDLEVPSGKHPVHYRKGEKGWSYGGTLMMTYGYTVSFTPMHIAMFYNGIANGGVMVKPRFVSRIEDPRNHSVIRQDSVCVINPHLCSDKTLAAIKQCLEGVVIRGTGKTVSVAKYKCAGKTGTASITTGTRGYDKSKNEYYGTFVGYFPADEPRYTVLVAMKTHRGASGQKPYSGALLSGPVFVKTVDFIYDREHRKQSSPSKYAPVQHRSLSAAIGDCNKLSGSMEALGVQKRIPSDKGKFYGIDTTGTVVSRDMDSDTMSLRGMALSDALDIIYSKGFSACVKGEGRVDRVETSGSKVTLYLKQ